MFDPCCSNSHKVNYEITHSPKPIKMLPDLREAIDRLLWYVPGINSVQSPENRLISNNDYSNAAFRYLLNFMGLNYETDVFISQIDKELSSFYDKNICINCQKILMSTKNRSANHNETLMQSFLRHLRNSIAHGNFIPIKDMVLFIDQNPKKEITAIIKVNVIQLNNALIKIEAFNGFTREAIIKDIFKRTGFEFINENRMKNVNDAFYIQKNDYKFAVILNSKIDMVDNNIINNISMIYDNLFEFFKLGYRPILVCDLPKAFENFIDIFKPSIIIMSDKFVDKFDDYVKFPDEFFDVLSNENSVIINSSGILK